ncbi:protein NTM1-like 9 isoform X2 [Citrus sinensis]|uniref:protein NTM1-like 9 isoform X2 n=1 Tax=Citrus sinensis TaxID=2711 RepID=UPI002277E36F|nr:protein NTM1-like 9 isoform X2 [Citrus sinensis]
MESLMGFRFQPSNEQIICLLEKKRLNPRFLHHTIKDIDDICSLEPWDLAGASKTESEDQVCYFFYKPYYKYKESTRAHRRTNAGYWKVTGRGSKIKTRNGLSGIKKILTFYYHGPASKKAKTGWVMHEYHVNDDPSYKGENSRKDTGQTLTPDLNSSKSDGGTSTYAEDSSDPNNTAYIDAWLDEPLEDGGASTYAKDSSDPNNIAYIDTWLDEPLEAGRASTLAEDSSDTNNTAYMDGWINGLLL